MNAIANWRTRLWRAPIRLGLLSVARLLSALIGDGAWDALSWVTLAPQRRSAFGTRFGADASQSHKATHDGDKSMLR